MAVATPTTTSTCCWCFPKPPKAPLVDPTPKKATNTPFAAPLPNLSEGSAICITGSVLPKCSRFAVDLTCNNKGPVKDIALHLNPRLLQRYFVRNSSLNQAWGQEEVTSTVKFPFNRSNRKFTLVILIGKEEFLIAVDGIHFCTFKFRVPWEKVKGIEIQGDVEVISVDYTRLQSYPSLLEPLPEARTTPLHPEAPKVGRETPATFLLPGGFRRGRQLEIYGRVKILPHSFYVNLQEGARRWPPPEVPLHLNPRFAVGAGETVFVRNARLKGVWGQEERSPGFQFEPGASFCLTVKLNQEYYSVWVDGKMAGEFKFRGGEEKVDAVLIEGDVVVFDVVLGEVKGR